MTSSLRDHLNKTGRSCQEDLDCYTDSGAFAAARVGIAVLDDGKEINLTGGFRFSIVMPDPMLLGLESGERRLEEEGI
jgi:hypothetical protein